MRKLILDHCGYPTAGTAFTVRGFPNLLHLRACSGGDSVFGCGSTDGLANSSRPSSPGLLGSAWLALHSHGLTLVATCLALRVALVQETCDLGARLVRSPSRPMLVRATGRSPEFARQGQLA